MPLAYDDVDGSWAVGSVNWPKLNFVSEEVASHAYHLAHQVVKVPYGSYVLVGRQLRLEDSNHILPVLKSMKEHPFRECEVCRGKI